MTNPRRLLAVAVTTAVLGALAPAGMAAADSQRTLDPEADVMRVVGGSDDDRCGSACEAFDRPEVVRGWRSTYDDRGLRMSAAFGAVERGVYVAWRVAAPGTVFTVQVRSARSRLTCGIYRPGDGYRDPDPCAGVRCSLDAATRTYRVEIEDRLLDGARSVRTGVGAWRRAGGYIYLDDGSRERFNPLRLRAFPRLGDSITRG